MTKREFRIKTRRLYKDCSKMLDARIEKILNSGCIDLKDFEDNYGLPKAFMTAFGKEISFQYRPLTEDLKETAKNIEVFM